MPRSRLNLVSLTLFLLAILQLHIALASQYCSLSASASARSSSSASGHAGNNGAAGSGGSSSPSSTMDPDEVVATAWYPGWLGDQFPLESLSWEKFSALTYAFGVTTPDVNTISLEASNEPLLSQFVSMAHDHDVLALLSIGGWSGSIYYSTAVGSAENRTAFVQTILGLVSKYNLDGIDFDWEYPNRQGLGCNGISPDDSANFLAFLQELRSDPAGGSLRLTAATGLTPFMGSDGTPMADVSEFAAVLDYIAIMNYDVWGSWSSTVGPNAPLDDSCSNNPQGSAVSAVQAWTAASFPANQIVLGVAAYGHSFYVDPTTAKATDGTMAIDPPFDKTKQPMGDSLDAVSEVSTVDECGVPGTGLPSGIWDFWGLVDGGFLGTDGKVVPGGEVLYRYDDCSQTPYLYNTTTNVMVSYDDADSFAAKGRFIDTAGLRGFAIWHAVGDYNDILIDSISDGIGIESVCSA